MSLKYKVQSKEEVKPEHLPLYVERDGSLVLDVEGATDRSVVEELRGKNATLLQQLETQRQRFDGIDPEEVRKFAEDKRKLEEAQQLKSGDVDRVLESRVRALKSEHDKQLASVTSERDALTARLAAIQIDQAIVSEASKRGLRATAIPDITARARATFRLVNGVPQAFEAGGQTVRVGKDGLTPLTLADWIDTQVSEAPHLFEANVGSGVPGIAGTGHRVLKNPFRKETWNLTEQMRLIKTDPQLAERLKAAA